MQAAEQKKREKTKRKAQKDAEKREKASLTIAQPHQMKPMTSLGSLRSMESNSKLVALNVWGAPEETEAEADIIEAEEDAAIFSVLSLEDVIRDKYILGTVEGNPGDEYLIVDADFGEEGEDACDGWNPQPVAEKAPSKAEIAMQFASGWFDGTAANYATDDCTFNPPGAPPMPLDVMLGMMGPVKSAFPEWDARVISAVENADGTCTVVTQQCVGKMQADMPAMGAFPAVALADAPELAKTTENAAFPREVGTYFFSADGTKVASGTYVGDIEAGGDPSPWFTERWNKKGDLSDVGFGLLYEWMGASLTPAPEPTAVPAPEPEPEPEPADTTDILTQCTEMFEMQIGMAKGNVTEAMMAEFGAKFAKNFAKSFTTKVNPKDEKPGPSVSGSFADSMKATSPIWMGFKNTSIKNVTISKNGEDTVVISQEYNNHLVDPALKQKIPETDIAKLKVVHTCKYEGNKVVEWTQEFDQRRIDKVRAHEERWKALKQQEAVNRGEKLAAAPSATPAKEDKLDTLIRDANRMIGGDADNELKIRGFFSKIDTDDDQRISRKELEAKWDEMKPWFVVALAKEPKLLHAVDQNNDGDFTLDEFWAFANEATKDHSPDWITSVEFVRALGLCGRRHQVTALLRMPFAGTGQEKVLVTESDHKKLVNVSATLLSHFDDIDSNQDQNLSRDELHHHVFSKKDEKAYNEIQAYMQMVDKDGDGHVSLDEFMAEADSDSNGVITHVEFFRALKNFAAAKMKSGRTGSAISVPVTKPLESPTKDRPKGPGTRKPTRNSRGPSVTEDADAKAATDAKAAGEAAAAKAAADTKATADAKAAEEAAAAAAVKAAENAKPVVMTADNTAFIEKLKVKFKKADGKYKPDVNGKWVHAKSDGALDLSDLNAPFVGREIKAMLKDADIYELFDAGLDGDLYVPDLLKALGKDTEQKITLEEFLEGMKRVMEGQQEKKMTSNLTDMKFDFSFGGK